MKLEVCGGFDGSDSDDWTVIRLETVEGWQFTPFYGPDQRPTIWNPAEWGGRIPRGEVHSAWRELVDRYHVVRVYADPGYQDPTDPTSWKTEIEMWAREYGEDIFIPWMMSGSSRTAHTHRAYVRFVTDLQQGLLTHDDCPVTATHIGNARKIAKPGDRYILAKPSQNLKIDAAVTSVLAHEAACDARAEGWGAAPVGPPKVSHAMYGFS